MIINNNDIIVNGTTVDGTKLTNHDKITVDSSGNVGIGTSTPAVSLDLSARTDVIALPRGTTAQRHASPNSGYLRYNTDLGCVESYHGSVKGWIALSNIFQAVGGTVVDRGGYRYHTFTSSGTFTVQSGTSYVDYLIVAGGGSGGGHYGGNYEGGGGGAGGMIVGTMLILAGIYGIMIGAGGSPAVGLGNTGGSNSTALGYTALGGGLGGPGFQTGGSGGSGGGGGWGGGAGSGTSGQGNKGGIPGGSVNGGGGGGGKTTVGANGADGGNGGSGYQWLDGTYYAGGGAGGRHGNGASEGGGIGGIGGGGNGQPASAAGTGFPGSTNTGGGGGGGWNSSASAGSNGGSGIVIVRYLI